MEIWYFLCCHHGQAFGQTREQTWYWLSKINGPLSSMRKDFNYLCHLSVEQWQNADVFHISPKMFSMAKTKGEGQTVWWIGPSNRDRHQGPVSIKRPVFPHIGIPIIKIRQSLDCLIFIMEILILTRGYLHTEAAYSLYFAGVVIHHGCIAAPINNQTAG